MHFFCRVQLLCSACSLELAPEMEHDVVPSNFGGCAAIAQAPVPLPRLAPAMTYSNCDSNSHRIFLLAFHILFDFIFISFSLVSAFSWLAFIISFIL
jgi:hypothetical protein